jgi:hypothetical protein
MVRRNPLFSNTLSIEMFVRQDLCDQLLDAGLMGSGGQMPHQQCADALPLMLVYHGERDLRPSRLHDDVTRSTDNHWSAAFVQDGYERQVVDEVDVQEEGDFILGELRFGAKNRR